MMIDIAMFAQLVRQVEIPILIANATLLALTSLRNGHVSDRARANVDEAIHKLPTAKLPKATVDKRLADLKFQNKWFITRYKVTSWSFICLALTLSFFAAAGALSPSDTITLTISTLKLAGIFALIASVLGFLGLGLLMFEFIKGPVTLISNNITLEGASYVDIDQNKPPI